MKFKDYFSAKHMIFAVLLFALLIPIAIWDSNTQVRVTFGETAVSAATDRYSMNVQYDYIESAELVDLPDAGEKVPEGDGFDDDIIRVGIWTNDTWGEYTIVADLDAANCIVMHLADGRTYVFSCKDNEQTAAHFETLQTHLS